MTGPPPDDLGALIEAEAARRGPPSTWWQVVRPWLAGVGLFVLAWMGLALLRAPALPGIAPDLTLLSLEGRTVTLSELRGQTVVVNFWAPWCAPCRQEIPGFSRFATDHPDVVVLGVAVDDHPLRIKAAARELGITYPVLLGNADTKSAWGVSGLPTTVIVGKDGAVRLSWTGVMAHWQLLAFTR